MLDLPQADRFYDHPSDNPFWNESVWFSFSIPERQIHGFVQYFFRPNMNLLNGGPAMWRPSGTCSWNCIYYNWSYLQPIPKAAKKFDMTAPNSLTVKVIEPLTRYRIGYDNEGFQMDLEWQAIHPMHELSTGHADQQATARFHIEHAGKMRGTIRHEGETYKIDCYSMRDTSYGPRDYATMSSGGYFWGISGESSFHGIAMGEGEEQKLIGGYLYRDGKLASLASGKRRILERGKHAPAKVLLEAEDKLGRKISAVGKIYDGLIHTGYSDHTIVWSLLEWEYDGRTHWGDNQEFCSSAKFRNMARVR